MAWGNRMESTEILMNDVSIADHQSLHGLLILDVIFLCLFWIAHGPLPSLHLGFRQISELLRNRVVIADRLSLHWRVILDCKLAESCLLRLDQCQQMLGRCQQVAVLLSLDRNHLFLKPLLAGRQGRLRFEMVHSLHHLTAGSKLLRE